MTRRFYNALVQVLQLPALPAWLLAFGTVLFFTPATVYKGNKHFFSESFGGLLVVLVPVWLLLALLAAVPSAGVATRRSRLYTRLSTAFAVTAWANATFAVGTKGLLDGTHFNLERSWTPIYQNLIAMTVVALIAFFAAGRFAGRVRTFILVLVGILGVQAASVAVTARPKVRPVADTQSLSAFHTNTNLLYLIFDTYQSDFFAEILEREPDLAKHLDGFTYFPGTASVSPTTYVAMPSLHSGAVWDTTTPLPDFYDRTVAQGSFLNTMADKGFDATLVGPIFNVCPKQAACTHFADIALGRSGSRFQAASELVDIALLRTAPHLLKPLVFRDGEWLLSGISLLRGLSSYQSNMALDIVAANLNTRAEKPTVKWLHLMNTHPPYQLTGECQYAGKSAWTRERAVAQARCAMTHFFALLDQLRKAGVYDATAIILTADHGSFLPRNGNATLAVYGNPLLLIKPPRASGALRISPAPASLADLPATACALSKACTWPVGVNVFALPPDPERERPFINYAWKQDYWKQGTFPIKGRYRIRGPVLAPESWEPVLGPAARQVHTLAFNTADPTNRFGPGWANAEKQPPRWAEGAGAIVWVDAVAGGSGQVAITVSTHDGNPAQQMEVFAGNQRVYQGAIAPGKAQDLRFQVPKPALAAGRVPLRFRFSQWSKGPVKEHLSPVSVAFHHLEIH